MNETRSSLPQRESCQAAVFVGAGQPLELRQLPLPELREHEAIVRVECCTICGSDLHTITGARTERTPSILGHEILGVVESVGSPAPAEIDGEPLQPGDRITWATAAFCGSCDRCRDGLPQKCRTLSKYGHELAEGRTALSGGLAECLLLRPGSAAIRVAPEILAEIICPVNCATATVAAACRVAGPLSGRRVLIFGAGMLGLTAAAFARSQGAALVVVCDVNLQRLERARQFGAHATVTSHADLNELRRRLLQQCQTDAFDVLLELSGSADAVEAAVALGDIGAQVVLVGTVMKSRPVQIDPEAVVRRWLSIHGVHNYHPRDLQTAVAFLEREGTNYPFAELVEFSYPLSEVNQAVAKALEARPVRIAIRP